MIFASRAFEAPQDLQHVIDLLIECKSRYPDLDWHHPGVVAQLYGALRTPQDCIRLWENDDGVLVGFAMVVHFEHGAPWCFVDFAIRPEPNVSVVSASIMEWLDSRAQGLVADSRAELDVVHCAREGDAQRISIITRHGFSNHRYEQYVVRDLDHPIPESPPPDGFTIRAVHGESEVEKQAELHRAVWGPHAGMTVESRLRSMRVPLYQSELDLVVEDVDGTFVSYCWGWLDPVNRDGYIKVMGTRPGYRRRGLCRGALLATLSRFKALGAHSVTITAGEEGSPSLRLYESVGFRKMQKLLMFQRTYRTPAV